MRIVVSEVLGDVIEAFTGGVGIAGHPRLVIDAHVLTDGSHGHAQLANAFSRVFLDRLGGVPYALGALVRDAFQLFCCFVRTCPDAAVGISSRPRFRPGFCL